MIFNSNSDYTLSLVHDKIGCFHMSGPDYMGQETDGSEKQIRWLQDFLFVVRKYEQCRNWLAFGYRKEYDSIIKELNYDVKILIEKYRTEQYWKFFKDKEHFCKKYGVSEQL